MLAKSRLTLAAETPQGFEDEFWTFTGWTDGGAYSHEIVAPENGSKTSALIHPTAAHQPGRSRGRRPEQVLGGATVRGRLPDVGVRHRDGPYRPAVLDPEHTGSRVELAVYKRSDTSGEPPRASRKL